MSRLDFLKPLSNFQYSINLEYDYNDEQKIKTYLPTSSSLSIIEEIILSTQDKSSARARLLTGAYGKGKSHMTLTILALLSGGDKKLFKNLLAKAKSSNINIYNNIIQYIDSKRKLLPVVVSGSTLDLKSSLLNSLSSSLRKNNLNSLMPKTFFDSAISKIENWRSKFKDTYLKFEKSVGYSGEEFVANLKQYDHSKYNLFLSIYPTLTAGSEFNPLLGTDVVKVYESVVSEIKKHGYSGVFIVYDEFGKFLEASVEAGSAMDIKLLQDLAEKCTRSESEQLHILLISHKGIDNYVGKLPKEKVDAWKAVSNRYTTISMQSRDSEMYEMIAQVLKKENGFNSFLADNKVSFDILRDLIRSDSNLTKRIGVFNEVIERIGVDFLVDCYPLHPYSLVMLPKISELVAQNERSIFTFLSSSEKNSVSYFSKRCDDDFPLIEPDQIYDYFEPLFKGESYGSNIRKHWQIANAAIAKLSKTGNQLSIKIVKTLSLIYMIDQFEILPPNLDLIFEIFSNHEYFDISAAIECVKQEQLLIELQFKPYVRIKESSGNDVLALIREETVRIEGKLDKKSELAKNMTTRWFYPIEYNDSLEITRYFRFEFLDFKDLVAIDNVESYIRTMDSDGIIFGILVKDMTEKNEAEEKIKSITSPRVVFVLPIEPKEINNYLLNYCAVNNLMLKKEEDLVLVEELSYIKNDLSDLINSYIETLYLKPELRKTNYYYQGVIVEIKRKKGLSQLLSQICYSIYNKTPIVVNENINRNSITSPMKAARAKILEGILSAELKANLGLTSSQDINVLRSVYVVPNIIKNIEEPKITFDSLRDNFSELLQLIRNFIISSANESKNFSELYDMITKPTYNIGLKKGLVPFYIGVLIRLYKQHLVIKYKDKEIRIDADLLSSINERPEAYQIKLENWDEDKEQYIVRLESMFYKYTNDSEKEYSTFDYIIRAIQRWYLHLSKLDKETKQYCEQHGNIVQLTPGEIKFKNLLATSDINSHEFLFDKLTTIFDTNDLNEITRKILDLKTRLENNIPNYVFKTRDFLFELLPGKGSLASRAHDYFDSLNEITKTHVFNGKEAALMDSLKEITNDEERFIKTLIRNLFTLRIEDLSDNIISLINDTIRKAKEGIDKYNRKIETEVLASSYKITYLNDNGSEQIIHINKEESSPQARLLYNDITSQLEEFGDSMSAAEKGQVLLNIIKEICK